jgi:hypothetical protein
MHKAIEAAARSDALFDGRKEFDAMSRHDRERYIERSRTAIAAFLTAAAEDEGACCPARGVARLPTTAMACAVS